MLSEKEAIELARGDYGKARHQFTTTYVAPFYWRIPGENNSTLIKNGTISFINLGEDTIGVTAGHVYKQYIEDKATNKNIVCNIMDENFDPEENIIDRNFDEKIDLATFKISEGKIKKIGKKAFYSTQPTTLIRKNDAICFAGYPGKERKEELAANGASLLSFGIYSNFSIASEVNEDRIICEYNESTIDTLGLGAPPGDYPLDGISGGILIKKEQGKIEIWSFGGIIREASFGLGVIFASPAKLILPNGQLSKQKFYTS